MLSPVKVARVRRMLAQGGISFRQIALETGVSHTSVRNIASGMRAEHLDFVPAEEDPRYWLPPARCPGCGGLVYGACVLCAVRTDAGQECELPEHASHDVRQAS